MMGKNNSLKNSPRCTEKENEKMKISYLLKKSLLNINVQQYF